MIDKDYVTQNGFDRNDTKMPNNKSQGDNLEDDYAQEIQEELHEGGEAEPAQQKNPIYGL